MSEMDIKLVELGIEPETGDEFSPITKSEVERLERRIGRLLPEGYRGFLMTYGSCMFGGDVYYHDPKCSQPVLFGYLYGYEGLMNAIESYAESIPENMIPIGDDGGGNQYCLGIGSVDRNKVYFHDHSIGWRADAQKYIDRGEEVPANIRFQTVTLIGESFENFIAELTSG